MRTTESDVKERMVACLKRLATLAAMAILASCGPGFSQTNDCDPTRIGYTPSALGVDYRERMPSPLAEIIAQGEAEYLAARSASGNPLTPQTQAGVREFWRNAINLMFAGRLAPGFTGTPNEPSFDLFRDNAPQMLARLKYCGPKVDDRLGYLRDVPLNSVGSVE